MVPAPGPTEPGPPTYWFPTDEKLIAPVSRLLGCRTCTQLDGVGMEGERDIHILRKIL